jgi:hypothetical protein
VRDDHRYPLANIYLHHVFGLWVDVWRRKCARGDLVVVRDADDLATSPYLVFTDGSSQDQLMFLQHQIFIPPSLNDLRSTSPNSTMSP